MRRLRKGKDEEGHDRSIRWQAPRHESVKRALRLQRYAHDLKGHKWVTCMSCRCAR